MTSIRFGNTFNPYSGTVSSPTPAIRQGVYGGVKNYGIQRYLPILDKRELTKPEKIDVQKGLSQWFPPFGAGYSTPITQLLASPIKNAVLLGGIMGGLAAAIPLMRVTAAIAVKKSPQVPLLCMAVLGSLLGGIGSAIGYFRRRQQNENILDLMQRLPPNATKRDMLSDPVYQADLDRTATAVGRAKDHLYTFLSLMISDDD